jgi:hypothetical protein
LAGVVAIGCANCLAGHGRGYPLYPADAPRKPDEVSQLTGYVSKVDGTDVTEHGHAFELLPGCHLIVTPAEWGKVGDSGGITWKTGHLTFALPMRPARQYLVEVQASPVGGASAGGRIVAIEKDMQGNEIKIFGPASSSQDVASCKAEAGP